MAALAETLVDEWLNRQGFFTVRGLRSGVQEIDLLGVRPTDGHLEAWHVEVQASFRPISYIAPLAKNAVGSFAKGRTSAKIRPPDLLVASVKEWVEKKFTSQKKVSARNTAWPGLEWEYLFVHAEIKHREELTAIAAEGVEVIPLRRVLTELEHQAAIGIRGSAGTDIAEIVEYFHNQEREGSESA